MSKLIEMPSKGGVILIEVETLGEEVVQVNKLGERIIHHVEQSFDRVEEVVANSCTILTDALRKLAEKERTVETAAIEFGLQFTGEGNIYLVKAAGQGTIKVSINLKLQP